ncbi:MAG: hypothetical protein F4138_04435 [Acidimicrobiia bacterium]|nr:hypothetical protein [Acidimicrobiia bacterium]MYC58467.1 hypothetical protein [Acidimicrobiia bacterium]MYG94225.1 hypothetical protein [Acidimicrobiia bacterium]MYI30427.1 hypothetical protein [Acidimicrobiia bacterium]
MSDAIAFLLILPAMMLAVVVLDAAGTLGAARHSSVTFAEIAVHQAADTLRRSDPFTGSASARSRWDEVSATVKQAGWGATAGVCDQTAVDFQVAVVPQTTSNANHEVAVVVRCPVTLGPLWATDHVVAASIAPLQPSP